MKLRLKQYRVAAGLTQTELAKAVGVSQPNYQRWESGAAPVPEDKLQKLAKALEASVEALKGVHPPIEAGFYDHSIDKDLNYYGEVAVHFHGEGRPLLLSISDGAFERLHYSLQTDRPFFVLESLSNQTVIVRAAAIADLYFSSEAYDDYGPEHDDYEDFTGIQMPDPRDWEIVEAIAYDEELLDDFAPEDVQRVKDRIMITDEQYRKLVADGHISPEDLPTEIEKNQAETDRIYKLATDTVYQFSTGKQRSVGYVDPEDLFEAFEYLLAEMDDGIRNDFIRLPVASWHRIAFINKQAVDYIMLPTHRLKQGRVEVQAKLLDE